MKKKALSPQTAAEALRAWQECLKTNTPLILLPALPESAQKILLEKLPEDLPQDTALVVFSSGTSGEPKAILHTKENLAASAAQLEKKLAPYVSYSTALPPWGMLGFLLSAVLPERALSLGSSRFNALAPEELWWTQVPKQKGIFFLNPWQVDILLDSGLMLPQDLSFISFTAPLRQKQKDLFQEKGLSLLEGYGMSEAAGPVLWEGKSLGASLSLSENAELCLEGSQLFSYSVVDGVLQKCSAPFATGDCFSVHEGRWQFLARARELIDRGGQKIAPRLVEELLEKISGVKAALVFAIPDAIYGENIGAILECDSTLLSADLERKMAESLSISLRPTQWIVERIPRTAAGKADRKAALKLLIKS